MTGERVKVTPAQRRYLEALADLSIEHPIRVLTRGSQWKVRSRLEQLGLITIRSAAESDGPRRGDNLTELGRATVQS